MKVSSTSWIGSKSLTCASLTRLSLRRRRNLIGTFQETVTNFHSVQGLYCPWCCEDLKNVLGFICHLTSREVRPRRQGRWLFMEWARWNLLQKKFPPMLPCLVAGERRRTLKIPKLHFIRKKFRITRYKRNFCRRSCSVLIYVTSCFSIHWGLLMNLFHSSFFSSNPSTRSIYNKWSRNMISNSSQPLERREQRDPWGMNMNLSISQVPKWNLNCFDSIHVFANGLPTWFLQFFDQRSAFSTK